MATSVTYNGNSYSIPAYNDTGYAQGAGNLSSYLIALATGSLTLAGGTFTLTADTNFGGNFGLIALYLKSVTSNIASAGFLRMANTDLVEWRNAANSGNNTLGVNGSNQLVYNGTAIASSSGIVPVTAGGTGLATLTSGAYLKGAGTSNVTFQAAPIPVADGGTNSTTSLNNNRVMKSSGGAIVEAAAITASRAVVSDANGIPATGTNTVNAAGYIIGTVLQRVTATSTSSTTTNSSTFQSTNLTASITPAASTHVIRVTATATFEDSNIGATDGGATIFRGASDINPGAGVAMLVISGGSAIDIRVPTTLIVVDSPASTSSTTYTVKIKVTGGAANNVTWGVSGTQYILLEEIAA